MSKSLEETIELLRDFPEDRQDAIAAALLTYLSYDDTQQDHND